MAEVLPGPFLQERTVFEEHRAELVRAHEDDWVLIKGNQILGVFPEQLDAIHAGWRQLGDVPFWVGEIRAVNRVYRMPGQRYAHD